MNKVVLTGRTTKEVVLKATQNGKHVTNFTLAVDHKKKDECDFIPCVAWEKIAELLKDHTTKGSKILVEGQLATKTYTNKDNKHENVMEVKVERVEFMESSAELQRRRTTNATEEYENELEHNEGLVDYETKDYE